MDCMHGHTLRPPVVGVSLSRSLYDTPSIFNPLRELSAVKKNTDTTHTSSSAWIWIATKKKSRFFFHPFFVCECHRVFQRITLQNWNNLIWMLIHVVGLVCLKHKPAVHCLFVGIFCYLQRRRTSYIGDHAFTLYNRKRALYKWYC